MRAIEFLVQEMQRTGLNRREYYWQVYLQSDHWETLRGLRIRKAGGICEICGKAKPLDVHHKKYRSLFDVSVKDLMALCRICHDRVHKDPTPTSPAIERVKTLMDAGREVEKGQASSRMAESKRREKSRKSFDNKIASRNDRLKILNNRCDNRDGWIAKRPDYTVARTPKEERREEFYNHQFRPHNHE